MQHMPQVRRSIRNSGIYDDSFGRFEHKDQSTRGEDVQWQDQMGR